MKEFKSTLVLQAINFATKAHEGQVRKYTGEPYIQHPISVAMIVSSVDHSKEMIAAALLHDVVEDCGIALSEIKSKFGPLVAIYVSNLTDVSKPTDGNRAQRKELDRKHIEFADADSKTIKLADLIHNSESICKHDREFARVYIKEKELLLAVLKEGDSTLYKRASDIVEKAKLDLNI